MRLNLIFFLLLLCSSCHQKPQLNDVTRSSVDSNANIDIVAPEEIESAPDTSPPIDIAHSLFKFIKDFPRITDTLEFTKELKKFDLTGCSMENTKHKITYYKKISINGSSKNLILLECDYMDGCGACFPFKQQFLFTENGHLIKSLGALRFELLEIFPKQKPFLLILISTHKGNGGHEIYKLTNDTLENIYDGYKNCDTKTYDMHHDQAVFEPYELKLLIRDCNHDGLNDLIFKGNIVLLQPIRVDGMWYNDAAIDEDHPFLKIPIEYIFLYDKRTGHFKSKQDYSFDKIIEKQLANHHSELYRIASPMPEK